MDKFGSIKITKEFVIADSKNLSIAFSKIGFVPLWITNNYHGVFKYIGYSDVFKAVAEGYEAPEYYLEVSRDKDNCVIDANVFPSGDDEKVKL